MTSTAFTNDPTGQIASAVQAIEPRLVEIRRDLHAHPELGFEEVRTAGVVAAELTRMGVSHRTGIGRTGVLGVIEGSRPGPTLAIRADMDALPIAEETGLPYASTEAGKMHACGHDIHTSTLLGVAEVLKGLSDQIAGRVVLVFQPAEEILGGAAAMIEDGALDGVDFAIGFHNHPDMAVGTFGFCRGATLAAADRFDLIIQGKSGHAAHPHTTVDPIVAGAAFVSQAQTVVSREIPPLQPAVVTIGAFNGGTVHNIIPERVHLKGTIRTLHHEARDIAEQALKRLVDGLIAGHRVQCDFQYVRGVPPLVNDDKLLDATMAAVRAQFGSEVVEEGIPSMGAEDFAYFAEKVPGFQLRIGSSAPGRSDRLHNAFYQPDEDCIGLGVQALSRAALDILR
ncbi:amidohydrolase [Acetobacteraceae bacterium H6797]|nr:amidohydrolase [Acetobacteraceae bacterium H6797]